MTTNRISRFNGTSWDPIYDGAALVSSIIAGTTTLSPSTTSGTITVTGGTGVSVAGASGTNTITLSIGQSVATSASPSFASVSATASAGPQLTLGNGLGASATILFSNAGVLSPQFTTRSAGTKIVLWSQLDASNVDYAIGIDGSTQWYSVPTASGYFFKWYGGTTTAAVMTSAGALTLAGLAYVNGSSSNPVLFAGGGTQTARSVIISTAAPSGGSSGDIWMRYV